MVVVVQSNYVLNVMMKMRMDYTVVLVKLDLSMIMTKENVSEEFVQGIIK